MTAVVTINCSACGAPLERSEGQNTLECGYCGCQLHYSPRKHIQDSDLQRRKAPTSDVSNEIFFINEGLDEGDNQKVYEYSAKLIEKEPIFWMGYFYAAHGLFWTTSGVIQDASYFFARIEEVIDLLKSARKFADDVTPIVQLEEDVIFNLCAVANRQGRSDFVGSNIQQSFQLFLYARELDPNNGFLKETLRDYAERLTNWSAEQLVDEGRQSSFAPNPSYLEYIYYCWKYFGVVNRLDVFDEYSSRFLKQASNQQAVEQIRVIRNEIIPQTPKEKSKGFFGFLR